MVVFESLVGTQFDADSTTIERTNQRLYRPLSLLRPTMLLEALDNYFRHPWIVALLLLSLFLLLGGIVAEIVLGPLWGAFFGIYAILVFLVAIFWYVSAKLIGVISNRAGTQTG